MDDEQRSRFAQCFGDLLSTRQTQHLEDFGFLHLHKYEDGKALGIFERDGSGKHSHFVLMNLCQESLIDSTDVAVNNNNNNNNNNKYLQDKFAHSTPDDKIATGNDASTMDGSPLKMQIYADLSSLDSPSSAPTPVPSLRRRKQRQKIGLPLRRARMLASFYMACSKMAQHKEETTLPALWIMCDADDLRSTAVFGVEHLSSASTKTSTHSFKVTMLGIADRAIVDSHHRALPWKSAPSTHAWAVYDVLESQVEDRVGYQGSLTIHLTWRDAFVLLQPPPTDATAVIKVAAFAGDLRSPVFPLYQELKMLQSLVTAMATGELCWVEEDADVPLLDSVRSLLDWLKMGHSSLVAPSSSTENSDNAASADLSEFKERLDFDFTDHIWKVFLKCTSLAELTQGLHFVFAAIIRGEVQPMVMRSNQTTLAQMVRETYQGRLSMPSLTGVFPLKLMVEIGVEKLRKDYAHAFISKGWSTMGHLEEYLSRSRELEGQVGWLRNLHQVLETVVMLQFFLKLPPAVLGTMARQLLQHYKSASPMPGQSLELPVPASAVTEIFQSYPPCQWGVEVRREVGGMEEVAGLTLSTSQPFCHVVLPAEEKSSLSDSSSSSSDKTLYYSIRRDERVLM